MGYFSNGTEGDRYEAQWCARCIHRPLPEKPDAPGCAVWGLQLFHNGEKEAQPYLDQLIPCSKDRLSNEQCRMFVEGGPDPNQIGLFT